MSGPFNVGDVVVCVDARPSWPGSDVERLRKGAVYRVSMVLRTGNIGVDGFTIRVGFKPWRFRKIDAASQQFTAQMRAIKPARKQVDA